MTCPRCGGHVVPDREWNSSTNERVNRCVFCGWREYLDPLETLSECPKVDELELWQLEWQVTLTFEQKSEIAKKGAATRKRKEREAAMS